MICDHGGVSRSLRRLLLALALACSGVTLMQAPAEACKCQVPSVPQASRQAEVVFTGVLLGEQRNNRQATLALEVREIFKGGVAASPVDVASPTDSCGLRLTEDQAYVVFARDGRGGLVSEACYGTSRATRGVVAAVERRLGTGVRFEEEPPEPARPAYTRLTESGPPEFSRVAAPGAALVLVGLLGWVVVRRRS